MNLKKKEKKFSFKIYFTIIEGITILMIISILVFSSFVSFKNSFENIVQNQIKTLQSFSNEVEFLKIQALEHIKNLKNYEDISSFSRFSPDEYENLFIINKELKVEKIFKKSQNSIIFSGFSFYNTYLKGYMEKNIGFALFITDIIRTIDDNISFYIIKLADENKYLVAEINLTSLINSISNNFIEKDSFFIITNSNKYIFYNTSKSYEFYFIPDVKFNHFVDIERNLFLISQMSPESFVNNFYLLSDFDKSFSNVIYISVLYFLFIIFSISFLIIKNRLNTKYFINPLEKTTNIISNWRISELENEIPKFFLGFNEIEFLAKTLINKYFEFQNEYEQLTEAEKTIRKMQKYLKNLIDSLPSTLISVDLNGRIIEFNKKAEELTGKKRDEVIGKNYIEIFPYLEKFKDNFQKVVTQDKLVTLPKESIVNGEEKIVNVNIIPISQNGLSGVAFRIDDVTELENLEKQIMQSQKMEIIGLLSGGIAHDLNNALTGIISTSSLIKEFIEENPSFKNPELIEYLDILDSASLRSKDIVQKLLALSRKKEIRKQPTNLQTCINDIERICKSTLEKSVELKFINPFSEAIVMGDQNLIIQAILNLCINANQAMTIMRKSGEKSGGTLTVKLEIAQDSDKYLKEFIESKKIYIENKEYKNSNINESFSKPEFWKISVSDTGVGIKEEIKDKIFEPFFTTKQAFYGSGIGLSTVKMIVEQHDGFIKFESVEGKGTTFYIYLPILKIEKFFETKTESTEIKKGSGLILVVDDEKLIRTITKSMLIKIGYNTLTATNYEEAINIFKKHSHNIKLVILDIAIPGKSGIEIFKEIKAIRKDTKVLFMTGLRPDEDLTRLIDEEADGFLNKPFTIAQLSNEIYNSLTKK